MTGEPVDAEVPLIPVFNAYDIEGAEVSYHKNSFELICKVVGPLGSATAAVYLGKEWDPGWRAGWSSQNQDATVTVSGPTLDAVVGRLSIFDPSAASAVRGLGMKIKAHIGEVDWRSQLVTDMSLSGLAAFAAVAELMPDRINW